MRRARHLSTLIAVGALAALTLCPAAGPARAQDAPKEVAAAAQPWQFPHTVKVDGRAVLVHEPQILTHDLDTNALTLRFPLEFSDAVGRPGFGAAECTGVAHIDLASRLIRADDLAVTSVNFTAVGDADKAAVEAGLAAQFQKRLTLRLELLTARLGAPAAKTPAEPRFVGQPPAIYLRRNPAVMVQLDGDPVLLPIEGFQIEYVVNTGTDILHKPSDNTWWMLIDGNWATAKAIEGPWAWITEPMPIELTQLKIDHPRGHLRQFMKGTPEYKKRTGGTEPPAPGKIPEVIVVKEPSELVLLLGDPLYTMVSPTLKLMTVANTVSDLIFHPKLGRFFLLLSGRWFASDELTGPWKPAFDALPEEFARIPRDHRLAHVLASVPKTVESREAQAFAALEDRVVVKDIIRLDVRHADKKPQSGTLPDSTAKHYPSTEDDVFEADGTYWACGGGAWFKAGAPDQSFQPVAEIPAALHSFTPSSGYFHDGYCRPLGAAEGGIGYAISAGYLGTFIRGGMLEFGTGWKGKGLLRNDNWYPWQSTYGDGRWYDAFQGEFQPRNVTYDEQGQPVATAWSPYTASYGRAQRYANRYWLGGRRAIPFNRSRGRFETDAKRSDPYDVWVGYVESRNGIPTKELPLGDRSMETVAPGPAYVAAADGVVYRTLPESPDKIESFAVKDGKGVWTAAANPAVEIRDAFRLRAWIDARPATHRAWAAKRRAALPVNPEFTTE